MAVLIDFPEIHFRLAKEFHRLGVPVIYFVSPQLWAWKKHRIKLVQKYVRRMLVIFPFEEPFYREHGVRGGVCRPSAGGAAAAHDHPRAVCREKRLDPAKTWIGLLPGSRLKEIATICRRCWRRRGPLGPRNHRGQPIRHSVCDSARADAHDCPAAPRSHQMVLSIAERRLPVRLVDDARATLFHARASVVASGTATVEAALIGNPFVVVYRVSPLTYAIAKRMVKVPHVAMANLIAGKRWFRS